MSEPLDVTRNEAEQRFEHSVDGETAFLTYRLEDNRLTLVHTEVPEAFEGRGIGGRLVHAVLEYAREHDLTVVPECTFVRSYLKRHPEEQDVVAEDQREKY